MAKQALVKSMRCVAPGGMIGYIAYYRTDTRHRWRSVRNQQGRRIFYVTRSSALDRAEEAVKAETSR